VNPISEAPVSSGSDELTARRRLGRALIVLALVVLVAFWTWALFFASKESINRIDDRAWAERAQAICADANAARDELADYRRVDATDLDLLRERGDLIDRSTDVVERMIDDVTRVAPADAKGRDIVPRWESDYRIFIANRRDHAQMVRAGDDVPFRQAEVGGVPISERLTRFAVDNDMPACAAPRDL
jgi:hypothetical protein